MDDEKLERIAARMREVGERTDLLIYERMRIAAKQAKTAAPTGTLNTTNGFMLACRRSRRPLRTASTAAGAIFEADVDQGRAPSIDPAAGSSLS